MRSFAMRSVPPFFLLLITTVGGDKREKAKDLADGYDVMRNDESGGKHI